MKLLVHVNEDFDKIVEVDNYMKSHSINKQNIKTLQSFFASGSIHAIENFKQFILSFSPFVCAIDDDTNNGSNNGLQQKAKFKRHIKGKPFELKQHSNETNGPNKTIKPLAPNKPKTSVSYFNSAQIAQIYQLNTINPTQRVTIGIIELGGGFKISDLNTYWNAIGLTKIKPTVVAIPVNGGTNNPSNINASYEVMLDIEVVGGVCPNSAIRVYFAPNTTQGFYNAIAQAISDKCNTISISWGAAESYWSTSTLNAYNNLFATAVAKGINVCCASGDNNANDGTNSITTDFPASSPNVVACGGTKLVCSTLNYNGLGTAETVWKTDFQTGTGAGVSSFFTVPNYQKNNIPSYPSIYRAIPDLVGNADPATGWLVYMNKRNYVIGGTSAVAPMASAYIARIGVKKFINPIIYANHGTGFHDIINGNNNNYSAGNSWDICTSYGSINGSVLTPLLKNS
jgi:kumamolisin